MGAMQKTLDKLRKTADKEYIKTAAGFFVGFLLATVQMGDMRPFGIAFGLSRAKGEASRCAGAFLGSLLTLKDGGVLYAAAIMICFSCNLVFRETKLRHMGDTGQESRRPGSGLCLVVLTLWL